MGRELAGVIACIQEIELACQNLEEKGSIPGMMHIETVMNKVRAFFRDSSKENARDVYDTLMEIETGFRKEALEMSVFDAPVYVDGIETSLKQLAAELLECLEDL
ncbi:MAG: hypothetical protein H6757_05850 [Candidatus Omnitrophica bacterium]|nr:hypothetical protein [Candidatus Omnitrophota bacterium]